MSEVLSAELQSCLFNSIASSADLAYRVMAQDAGMPHVLMRPSVRIDGNKWCALYGETLQDGVAGFGDSPYEAMRAFDSAWYEKLQARAALLKASPSTEGQL